MKYFAKVDIIANGEIILSLYQMVQHSAYDQAWVYKWGMTWIEGERTHDWISFGDSLPGYAAIPYFDNSWHNFETLDELIEFVDGEGFRGLAITLMDTI